MVVVCNPALYTNDNAKYFVSGEDVLRRGGGGGGGATRGGGGGGGQLTRGGSS